MENIKILKNILTSEEAEFFIKYIDFNIDKFDTYSDRGNPNRCVWRFGVDEVWTDSNPTLAKLSDIHDKLKDIFDRVTSTIQELYNDQDELYVTSFHLGKQLPGAIVARHLDAGPNDNGHFKYSCVIYLNSNDSDGTIRFDALDFEYTPESYAAIVFPSKGEEYEHQVDKIANARYSLPMWITSDKNWEINFN